MVGDIKLAGSSNFDNKGQEERVPRLEQEKMVSGHHEQSSHGQ